MDEKTKVKMELAIALASLGLVGMTPKIIIRCVDETIEALWTKEAKEDEANKK